MLSFTEELIAFTLAVSFATAPFVSLGFLLY